MRISVGNNRCFTKTSKAAKVDDLVYYGSEGSHGQSFRERNDSCFRTAKLELKEIFTKTCWRRLKFHFEQKMTETRGKVCLISLSIVNS